MARGLDVLEAQLGSTPWLAGERFSTVDIAWMPNLHRMALMRFPLDSKRRLRGWSRRVTRRPSFQRALTAYEPWPLRLGLGAYAAARGLGGAGLPACLSGPRSVYG